MPDCVQGRKAPSIARLDEGEMCRRTKEAGGTHVHLPSNHAQDLQRIQHLRRQQPTVEVVVAGDGRRMRVHAFVYGLHGLGIRSAVLDASTHTCKSFASDGHMSNARDIRRKQEPHGMQQASIAPSLSRVFALPRIREIARIAA